MLNWLLHCPLCYGFWNEDNDVVSGKGAGSGEREILLKKETERYEWKRNQCFYILHWKGENKIFL